MSLHLAKYAIIKSNMERLTKKMQTRIFLLCVLHYLIGCNGKINGTRISKIGTMTSKACLGKRLTDNAPKPPPNTAIKAIVYWTPFNQTFTCKRNGCGNAADVDWNLLVASAAMGSMPVKKRAGSVIKPPPTAYCIKKNRQTSQLL